jgi:hypothetical protein
MIQHIFELLAESGVEEVHVNVHHLAEVILGCYGGNTRVDGMSVNVSREERLMGTAGGSSGSPSASTRPSSSSWATPSRTWTCARWWPSTRSAAL